MKTANQTHVQMLSRNKRHIEIMDTTLRDGEQTNGISFTPSEKLSLAQSLLTKVKVDRIEVASARVSSGEFEAVKKITQWAKKYDFLNKIEVLAFVDKDLSIEWVHAAKASVINLLTKGSLNHLTHQLKKTPTQHFSDIAYSIASAKDKNITVNVYLEDWSNGMKHSPAYVWEYLDFISQQPVQRVMLPDTLGILTPREVFKYISTVVQRYPHIHFDFHGHNDYDLSVANTLEAIHAGVSGVHVTVNGMGERTGNAPLASTVAAINDYMPHVYTSVSERSLYNTSKIVETFSGFRIPANKPIVGENVFTQTAGIHADGDKKNKLYVSALVPGRFDRKRVYALGKTSGKANIEHNLHQLGIQLSEEDIKKVTARVVELGDKKEVVTQSDLPYIISDVLDDTHTYQKVCIEDYMLVHACGLRPSATVKIRIRDHIFQAHAQGDGQYDAFMKALKEIYTKQKIELPQLIDYIVRIPPGGKTDALCETIITWYHQGKEFKTRGLDSDQTVSAIKATQKMLVLL